ncbi:MAG: TonB-dependent receptor [bacterium]
MEINIKSIKAYLKKFSIFGLLSSLLIIYPVSHLYAEEKEIELDKVVVTATRTSGHIEDIPVQVEVITEEEIKESGAQTVGDLIAQKVTGHVHTYSGLQQPVGLRGFRSDSCGDDIKGHILILIDGHRVGTGNMAKINTDFIERVEIIKGPASSLYGSAAMGGVINLITKKGKGQIKNKIKQELGSFRYQKSLLSSEGSVSDRFSYAFNISYEDAYNYHTKGYGELYNTDKTRKDVAGALCFYPSDEHCFRLGFAYADLEASYPSWSNYQIYTSYNSTSQDYSDKSHGMTDLEYNGSFLNDNLRWKNVVYYLWDKNAWYFGTPTVNDSATIYEDKTVGTDQQFTITAIPDNILVFGTTYENLEKEAEGRSSGLPSRPATPGLKYTSLGLYTQDTIKLLDNRLALSFGGRYDRYELSTKKPETGNFESFNERTVDFKRFTPKVGLVYKFNDLLRTRASVSEGFKSPSADEMSARYEYSSRGSSHKILGNPDLKPEKSTNYELGFDLEHKQIDAGISFFHTDYRDKIEPSENLISYEGKLWNTYENKGGADLEGIDLNFKWRINKTIGWEHRLELFSNITFNTKYKDSETKEDLYYVSDYEARSGLRLAYKDSTISLAHVLVGPQKIQNQDNYPISKDEHKKSFDFYNLTLLQRLYKDFELEASIYNLFDQEYEWVRGYPMPERNFKLGLSYNF